MLVILAIGTGFLVAGEPLNRKWIGYRENKTRKQLEAALREVDLGEAEARKEKEVADAKRDREEDIAEATRELDEEFGWE